MKIEQARTVLTCPGSNFPTVREDGMLHVDERPGLGVNFDEDRAADNPYRRAYLPVARRRDGCVHSW